jgi:hypothetical protein
VAPRTGYRLLKDAERTYHNNTFTDETRGRKKKITNQDLDKVEDVLWRNGIEGRRLSNQAL